MHKIFNFIETTWWWAVSIFFIAGVFLYFPSLASVLMLLAVFAFLPLKTMIKLRRKLIPKKGLRIILAIVDIDNAEDSKETKILEYDAVIYTLNEREYLCWTISPEISCVLEYTPGTVSDEDIRLMAESVQ